MLLNHSVHLFFPTFWMLIGFAATSLHTTLFYQICYSLSLRRRRLIGTSPMPPTPQGCNLIRLCWMGQLVHELFEDDVGCESSEVISFYMTSRSFFGCPFEKTCWCLGISDLMRHIVCLAWHLTLLHMSKRRSSLNVQATPPRIQKTLVWRFGFACVAGAPNWGYWRTKCQVSKPEEPEVEVEDEGNEEMGKKKYINGETYDEMTAT